MLQTSPDTIEQTTINNMKQRFTEGQLVRLDGMMDTFIVKILSFNEGNYSVMLMSSNGLYANTYRTETTLPDSYLSPLF